MSTFRGIGFLFLSSKLATIARKTVALTRNMTARTSFEKCQFVRILAIAMQFVGCRARITLRDQNVPNDVNLFRTLGLGRHTQITREACIILVRL